MDESLLLKKITSIFLGTHDFHELARRAVDLIVKELKSQGIATAGIGRVHEKENLLSAYAYATKFRRTIDKLLPSKFNQLSVPLSRTDNLGVRTVVTGQIQQSKKMADFSRGIISDELIDKIQKIMRGRLSICFPIKIRSGKVVGMLLLVTREEKITGEQLVLFETFAEQLGLAFANTMAFEKLITRYKKEQASEINEENLPSIKFTLRITPKQNKNLDRLARERGKTKAELIREILEKD